MIPTKFMKNVLVQPRCHHGLSTERDGTCLFPHSTVNACSLHKHWNCTLRFLKACSIGDTAVPGT